jgi:hypothetical protein
MFKSKLYRRSWRKRRQDNQQILRNRVLKRKQQGQEQQQEQQPWRLCADVHALFHRLSEHNAPGEKDMAHASPMQSITRPGSWTCTSPALRKALSETRAELFRTRDRLRETQQQVRELEHDRTSLEQALMRVLELDQVLQNGQTPFRASHVWETPREDRLFSRAGVASTPWLERSTVWFSPREPNSAKRALIIQEAFEKRFPQERAPRDEWDCSPVLQTSDLTADHISLPRNDTSAAYEHFADRSI